MTAGLVQSQLAQVNCPGDTQQHERDGLLPGPKSAIESFVCSCTHLALPFLPLLCDTNQVALRIPQGYKTGEFKRPRVVFTLPGANRQA